MCDANSIDTHVSHVTGYDPHYFQDHAAMSPDSHTYLAAAEVGVDIATRGLYGIWKSANEGDVVGIAVGLSDSLPGCAGSFGKVLGVAGHASTIGAGMSKTYQAMMDARK